MTTTVIVTAGHKGATVRQVDDYSSQTENSYSYGHSQVNYTLDPEEQQSFVVTDTRTINVSEDRVDGVVATAGSGPAHAQLSGDALNRARAAQRDLVRSLGDSAQNAAEHEAAVAILAILDEAAGVE